MNDYAAGRCPRLHMMKSSLLSAALVLGIGISAHAQNALGGASSGRIRLAESYVRASCALKKALEGQPAITDDVSVEKMQEAFDRRTALEEQYKDTLSRPYPPELESYVPTSFEYAEHLFTGFPCEEGLETKAEMPAGFRCRLDQVVFRDPVRKQELKVDGGSFDFEFIYDGEDGMKVENTPRPLSAGAPRVAGYIQVRGQMAGKSYTVSRAWTGGSPVEALASRVTNPKDSDDAVMPAANLPYVTAENAAMFVFDLKHDTLAIRDTQGGPLKELQLYPYRCQK
jgi:hypothetical protein